MLRGLALTALALGAWAAADSADPGTARANDRPPPVVTGLLGGVGETLDALLPNAPLRDAITPGPRPKPQLLNPDRPRQERPLLLDRPDARPEPRPQPHPGPKPAEVLKPAPVANGGTPKPARRTVDGAGSVVLRVGPQLDPVVEALLALPLIDPVDDLCWHTATLPGSVVEPGLTDALTPILTPLGLGESSIVSVPAAPPRAAPATAVARAPTGATPDRRAAVEERAAGHTRAGTPARVPYNERPSTTVSPDPLPPRPTAAPRVESGGAHTPPGWVGAGAPVVAPEAAALPAVSTPQDGETRWRPRPATRPA